MAEWLSNLSGKLRNFGKSVTYSKSLTEELAEVLDPSDARVAIRPLGDDWLCPFTGKRVLAPAWNGSSLTLMKCKAITDHLTSQPELQKLGGRAQLKTFEELVQIAVNWRLSNSPNFKLAAPDGEWVCPYCLQKSSILLKNWDGSATDLDFFIPQAWKHLKDCAQYQQDPVSGAKSVQEIEASGGDRAKVSNLVENDPRFRICDAEGSWLCPYSARPVARINLKREPWGHELQQKIVDYVMSPDCPGKYSQYNVERTAGELKAVAAKKMATM
ncbi:MAG: hypothetical protein ABSE73_15220 [Planctomycetota bacterium]